MQNLPSSERLHIGFFGRRNTGKSSLVNAITGQELSIVSETKGTTTDPVIKAMELLPLGPVVIIDTPGLDDTGSLGNLRSEKGRQALSRCDIAVLVTDAPSGMNAEDIPLLKEIKARDIPYLTVHTKSDLLTECPCSTDSEIWTSSKDGSGIEALKEKLGTLRPAMPEKPLVRDLLHPHSLVLLVCPIDESAPKGRLILPQQLVLREVLDCGCMALVLQPDNLAAALEQITPALIITDSQVFGNVARIVPESIPLTSFSILMARYKGFLSTAVQGAAALSHLSPGASILMAEGCTHHRQCNDIGTVKIPNWLRAFCSVPLSFSTCSGHTFPEDLSSYAAVIHCGGCMITEREVMERMHQAEFQGIPFTNYGIAIAYMNGILERCLRPIPSVHAILEESV